jgi:hypothetical protein
MKSYTLEIIVMDSLFSKSLFISHPTKPHPALEHTAWLWSTGGATQQDVVMGTGPGTGRIWRGGYRATWLAPRDSTVYVVSHGIVLQG